MLIIAQLILNIKAIPYPAVLPAMCLWALVTYGRMCSDHGMNISIFNILLLGF